MHSHSNDSVSRAALVNALVLTVVLVAGCEHQSDGNCPGNARCVPPDAGLVCDDPPATLDDCQYVNATYANCGGSPGPYLACNVGGTCRWFAGACMPPGFEASSCDADAVCCHDDWPWPASNGAPYPNSPSAFNFLYAFGTESWAEDSATNVSVVALPDELPEPGFNCTGVTSTSSATCPLGFEAEALPAANAASPAAVLLRHAGGERGGWDLLIEVEGSLARVCILPFTDGQSLTCEFGEYWPGACANGGSVSLEGTSGTLDVTFPNGGTVTGRF